MKFTFSIISFALSVLLVSATTGFGGGPFEKHAEANQELRAKTAKSILETNPNTVSLYAKGLCCPSCGIGVRKKVGKLSFVDQTRFTKGVKLDTKTQLAIIALKEGTSPDAAALAQAVTDAGYDPVHLYRLNDGILQTTSLTKP